MFFDLLGEVGSEQSEPALQALKERFTDEPYIQFAADLAIKRIIGSWYMSEQLISDQEFDKFAEFFYRKTGIKFDKSKTSNFNSISNG